MTFISTLVVTYLTFHDIHINTCGHIAYLPWYSYQHWWSHILPSFHDIQFNIGGQKPYLPWHKYQQWWSQILSYITFMSKLRVTYFTVHEIGDQKSSMMLVLTLHWWSHILPSTKLISTLVITYITFYDIHINIGGHISYLPWHSFQRWWSQILPSMPFISRLVIEIFHDIHIKISDYKSSMTLI